MPLLTVISRCLFKGKQAQYNQVVYHSLRKKLSSSIRLSIFIANGFRHWTHRRIRMCYWRQWRKPRTKVRSLMKLGVSERLAIACGITSKGPCKSSKTKGINIALGNDYLASQGLVSLKDIWINIHYGR